ncbi:MAG: glycosyltransferase family 2 protein [Candidatus Nealsonbacteria bacterium]|nr:glycosyltransferase family 2 protein [Candidatus Nealsonbacteria bacterium]
MTAEPTTPCLPISVFIIAKDEADRIAEAIESVRDWADEVIVIDSGSSDETVAVAQRAGAQVLFHPWQGYGMQKRFGEESCRNDWLLNLDADERVTPELAREVRALFTAELPAEAAYRIKISEVYAHEKRPSRWAYTLDPIRLYDRRCGRFKTSPVHDRVAMERGKVGKLRHRVLHYSIRSLSHYLAKVNSYTDMQAADFIARGKRLSRLRLLIELPATFFKAYFLRKNVFLGTYGLIISVSYAYYRFIRLAKVYEHGLPDHAGIRSGKLDPEGTRRPAA